jgi:Flp pilus assembly protein TadD/4-amino-4-deoxy-L-arabinose transferase-like glycosyltransferase
VTKKKERRNVPARSAASRSRQRIPWALAAVFILAFLARFTYILDHRKSPFFYFPIIDSKMYDLMAVRYANGEGLWDGAFFWPPLYPWLLGVFYALCGHTLFGVRLAQALLGASSCLLLYGLGRRVFSRAAGVAAAVVMALYGTLIYFDAEILVPSLFIFLVLAGLLILIKAAAAPTTGKSSALWLGAGVLLGLAALAIPNVLIFVALAALWAWIRADFPRGRRRMLAPALLLLGTGLAISPVTLRNYLASGDFVLISANGGINFYLGNNAEAEETVATRPGFAWVHLISEPQRAGVSTPSAASRYFFDKGLSFLRQNPRAALSLYGSKLARFWNSFEIGRDQNVYGSRDESPLLSMLLWRAGSFSFPFGVVAPLACAGMIVCFSLNRIRMFLYIFLIAYMVSVLLFFVTARYRLPVVPILILFAVQYVLWVVERVKSGQSRRLRPVLWSLAGLLFLFPAMNRGFSATDRIYRSEEDRYLGLYHLTQHRTREAEAAYRRALDDDPDYADVHLELGQLLMEQGRSDEALVHLRRAGEICPFAAQTHYVLGTAYATLGSDSLAEAAYRRAIAIEDHGEAYRDLGILLLDQRRSKEAETLLLEARRLIPDDVNVWYRLSECYYIQGDYEKTEAALRGALRLTPEDHNIQKNLDDLERLRRQLKSDRK